MSEGTERHFRSPDNGKVAETESLPDGAVDEDRMDVRGAVRLVLENVFDVFTEDGCGLRKPPWHGAAEKRKWADNTRRFLAIPHLPHESPPEIAVMSYPQLNTYYRKLQDFAIALLENRRNILPAAQEQKILLENIIVFLQAIFEFTEGELRELPDVWKCIVELCGILRQKTDRFSSRTREEVIGILYEINEHFTKHREKQPDAQEEMWEAMATQGFGVQDLNSIDAGGPVRFTPAEREKIDSVLEECRFRYDAGGSDDDLRRPKRGPRYGRDRKRRAHLE